MSFIEHTKGSNDALNLETGLQIEQAIRNRALPTKDRHAIPLIFIHFIGNVNITAFVCFVAVCCFNVLQVGLTGYANGENMRAQLHVVAYLGYSR